jgi:hypothetical protein
MGDIIRLKIYCIECNFIGISAAGSWICLSPKNKGTWKSVNDLQKHPSELNVGNDCTWFKKKEDV